MTTLHTLSPSSVSYNSMEAAFKAAHCARQAAVQCEDVAKSRLWTRHLDALRRLQHDMNIGHVAQYTFE